jgi:hypothetical protein
MFRFAGQLRALAFVLVLLACGPARLASLWTASAHAQSPRDEAFVLGDDLVGFGARHQVAISSDAAMSIQHTSQTGTNDGSISVTVAPASDFFVIKNLSLGAAAGLQYARAGKSHSMRLSLGPRIGYNVEITHLLSFWPKIGLSYSYSATEDGAIHARRNATGINVFAPIMMHPVEHFFVGFGPFIDTDLYGKHRGTLWGGRMTLGGWL